jgi:hypothetical protein
MSFAKKPFATGFAAGTLAAVSPDLTLPTLQTADVIILSN